MIVERAPDPNLCWENWNDTVAHVKKLIENARDFVGPARNQVLRDAKNALNGVPDAHPEKAGLMRIIEQMK
jgi:hypothetical protein